MNRKQWQLPSGACGLHDGDRAAETIRQALEVTFLGLCGIIAPSETGGYRLRP
ncbi:MAG: hypothetical protein J4G00_11935 [Actinomycetia bacterium]|nr:hypothetical protein [Actinomycetes bacterium]